MDDKDKFFREIDFFKRLELNQLSTPNEYTVEMGELIRRAREEKGLSQAEFAKLTNRRPATISYIENGKSDISVLTLVLFAIKLGKPISYFFPGTLLKDWIVDVKTPFEHKMLEKARGIEHFGDSKLTLEILNLLSNYFEDGYMRAMNGEPPEEVDED